MSAPRDHNSDSDDETEYGLSNPDVTTKYTTAGEIANKALKAVLDKVKDGAEICDLCELGDKIINEETGKVYNKRQKLTEKEKAELDSKKQKDNEDAEQGRKIEKGIGFPTCISVNEIAGHFSPLKGEGRQLRAGDLVKVDLGVQIDGFIAQVGHTVLIQPNAETENVTVDEQGRVNDKRADVLKAGWTAAEAALRTIQVGAKNTDVTEVLQKSADQFKCQPVSAVLSHELKRYVIDGQNCILSKEVLNDEQKVDEFEFGLNEVYTMDVLMSTGEGKTREMECRHTVYKRAAENNYLLKTQKARQFLSEVGKKFPSLPFSLRQIEDEQCARVGVSEANRHKLLHEYPVLTERVGEFVAQFKFTVLILPGGVKKITGLQFDQEKLVESTHKVEDEALVKLLATSVGKKRRNKKKNSKEDASKEDN